MREFVYKITREDESRDIYWFLTHRLYASSNIISKMKQGEYILVNGEQKTVRYTLKEGDTLRLIIPSEGAGNVVSNPDVVFDVLYEDEDILAVEKPACVPTHPSIYHFNDTLANGVTAYLKDSEFTFRAINRLDRETSGIVLIAKNMLAAHILSKQVRERKIEKRYLAICEELPLSEQGEITAPIAREKESIITRRVCDSGQYAKTRFRVLKKRDNLALVDAEPITGRTHQIRLHFSHIGCPLFGDRLYGSKIEGERTRLHCYSMRFCHPITGEEITIKSNPPEDFDIIK